MRKLLLSLRGIVFYIGYVGTIILWATLCMIVGPFMSIHRRFPFFLVWNRFAMWWLKVICGIRIEVRGPIPERHKAAVILSNHQSPWETLYLSILFQPICAILKIELMKIPFFGWALRLLMPIPIDRSLRQRARLLLLKEGKDRLDRGLSVMVYPEGTRVQPGQEKAFSKGGAELAIHAGFPVIPVAHNAGSFWPAHKLIKHPGTIQVRVGEPIDSTGKNPKELTLEAETWIREQLRQIQ